MPNASRWQAGVGPSVVAAMLVMSLQIVGAWGHISVFWGDPGRWMYEVDRFAHGAKLYRDVFWAFPPAGMWVMGGIARVVGSDVAQIWSVTAAIALAIAAGYAVFVRRLIAASLAPWIAGIGMFAGMIYSQRDSSALSLGMYTPAVPLAVLVLFAQLVVFVGSWGREGWWRSALVGVLGGVGILTKHDVWLSCAWLTAAVAAAPAPSAAKRVRRLMLAGSGFLGVVLGGLAFLARDPDLPPLRRIFGGFGHVSEYAGLNMPDLSLITTELAVVGVVVTCIAAVGLVVGRYRGRAVALAIAGGIALAAAATAVWVGEAFVTVNRLRLTGLPSPPTSFEARLWPLPNDAWHALRVALGMLRADAWLHPIPFLLPLLAIALLLLNRRSSIDERRWRLLVVLLIAALLLRSRRMLSYPEWSSLMLELPLYVMAFSLMVRVDGARERRVVLAACLPLVIAAAHAQWSIGYGFASRRGRFPVTETARGAVHLHPQVAQVYNEVRRVTEQADPQRLRPILSTGYSAGFSYLLGRRTPASLSHGFRFSLFSSPEQAFEVVAREKSSLFLVEQPTNPDLVPVPDVTPWRWQPRVMLNAFERVDRAYFDRLRSGCAIIGEVPGAHGGVVYDCAVSGGNP